MLQTVMMRDSRELAVVEEHDVRALVARAEAARRVPELGFSDIAAEDLVDRMECGLDAPLDDDEIIDVVVASARIDAVVRGFFERHPDGVAVALHPGLCTRFTRVDNGTMRWVDLDPPALASLKGRALFTPSRHMLAVSCSIACRGWTRVLDRVAGIPTLVVHQGAPRAAGAFEAMFESLARSAPAGLEYVCDVDDRLPLQASRSSGGCVTLAGCRYPRARVIEPPGIAALMHARFC